MLSRPAVAISPDRSIRKLIGVGLMSAGAAVEVFESATGLPTGPVTAAVVVVHIEDSLSVALIDSLCERLEDDAWLIAIVPISDLESAVSIMSASAKIAAVLVADGLTSTEVARAASKVLYGDIFGLEKLVPWGTRIYSTLVGDYQDKSMCIAEMSQFAETMGVRRKYREAIEQCADEMLMNALYDAPVGPDGKPLFANVAIKDRIKVRMEQRPVVQYACTDREFMLSVRDPYGTLQRNTVLQYLDKCLHAEEQIDRKTHGAGLGLYLMAAQSSHLVFNVLGGVATECICIFDLNAPKLQTTNLGMYFERIDATGRLDPGRPTLLPGNIGFPVERRAGAPVAAPGRAVVWGLSAAIALLVTLIVLIAYPRVMKSTGNLQISTQPSGAIIELDGHTRGSTQNGPVLIKDLDVDSAYRITASLQGWKTVEKVFEPVGGDTMTLELALEPSTATVEIDSDPTGAAVIVGDRVLGMTPLVTTQFQPGGSLSIELSKNGYQRVHRDITVPQAGDRVAVSEALRLDPRFGSVNITSNPPGAQVLQNGELLAALSTPVSSHLVRADAEHVFTLRLPGYQPTQVRAAVAGAQQGVPVHADLAPGGSLSVRANVTGRVSVRGQAQCQDQPLPMSDCPLANGRYHVVIDGIDPAVHRDLTIEVDDKEVQEDLRFGIIEAARGYRIELGNGRQVKRVAVDPGTHPVTIVAIDTGAKQEVRAAVAAEQLLRVP